MGPKRGVETIWYMVKSEEEVEGLSSSLSSLLSTTPACIIGVDGRSGGEMGTLLLMPQSSCLAGDNVGESGEWGKEPLTIAGGEVMLSSSWKGGDEGGGTALVVINVEPHC